MNNETEKRKTMQTWTTIDKSNWMRGEWDGEPDKAQWIDETTGLDCLIVRGPIGALCGYVGIPESHPDFGKSYSDVDADVHGGLTFADKCNPQEDPAVGICHTGDVANKTVWWFGFDCAHGYDLIPWRKPIFDTGHEVYRNFDYVRSQVDDLAKQLALKGETE